MRDQARTGARRQAEEKIANALDGAPPAAAASLAAFREDAVRALRLISFTIDLSFMREVEMTLAATFSPVALCLAMTTLP